MSNQQEGDNVLKLVPYDPRKFERRSTRLLNGQTVVSFTHKTKTYPASFFTGQLRDIAVALQAAKVTNRMGDLFNEIVPTSITLRNSIYKRFDESTTPYTDIMLGVLQLPNESIALSVVMRFNGLRPFDPANTRERGLGGFMAHVQRAAQNFGAFDRTFLRRDPLYEGDPSVQVLLTTEYGQYLGNDEQLVRIANTLTGVLSNSPMFSLNQ